VRHSTICPKSTDFVVYYVGYLTSSDAPPPRAPNTADTSHDGLQDISNEEDCTSVKTKRTKLSNPTDCEGEEPVPVIFSGWYYFLLAVPALLSGVDLQRLRRTGFQGRKQLKLGLMVNKLGFLREVKSKLTKSTIDKRTRLVVNTSAEQVRKRSGFMMHVSFRFSPPCVRS